MTLSPGLQTVQAALGPRAAVDTALAPLTTYGVGGTAALFIEVDDLAELDVVRAALAGTGAPVAVVVVGRGSNLLVSDDGFDGLVLRLGAGFSRVEMPTRDAAGPDAGSGEPYVIRAGAAVPLPVLARQAAEAGWSGLAWAVGVPGSVGGAVRMNAGGHGSDMAACVHRYTWVDLLGEGGGVDGVARLDYGYRSSSVRAQDLVVGAELRVVPGDPEVEKAEVSAIVRWRREHQPGGSNAGSVFTNPAGDSAGRLIEEAGLKGYRLGSAQVSEKHANFIQADRGGRAGDVRALMAHVREVVLERCGIALVPEVRLLGFGDDENGAMERDEGRAT